MVSMATKHKLLLHCSHYRCSCLPRYSHWQSFTECSGHLMVIVGTRYSYVIPINEVTEVAKSVWINRPLQWLQQGQKPLVDLHLQQAKAMGATACNKDGDSAFIQPCHTYICPVSILKLLMTQETVIYRRVMHNIITYKHTNTYICTCACAHTVYILSMWGSLKLAPINGQPVHECLMLTTNTALALSGLCSSHLRSFSVNTDANSVDNCKC